MVLRRASIVIVREKGSSPGERETTFSLVNEMFSPLRAFVSQLCRGIGRYLSRIGYRTGEVKAAGYCAKQPR